MNSAANTSFVSRSSYLVRESQIIWERVILTIDLHEDYADVAVKINCLPFLLFNLLLLFSFFQLL